MNVLHVNYSDLLGARFNGGALIPWMRARGHSARHAVGAKMQAGADSVNLVPSVMQPLAKPLVRIARYVEREASLQSVLYPQSFLLPFNEAFKAADVVHYHIIHNQFFSYLALPWLTKRKPSVWSLHDPWAMTGHCVHPFRCEGWKTGCDPCPHLDYPFALKKDHAGVNYKLKDLAYRNSSLQLVVASRWMQGLVEQSPLLARFPVHHVPFGLDLGVFSPGEKAAAKAKYGIPADKIVVGMRALPGPFKGLEYAIRALKALPSDANVHVLTCEIPGLLSSLDGQLPMTELGEVHGDEAMVDFFRAMDIHLMPSLAESFGMMAMEAAACGVPSVVFTETPLPEICFAPHGGIAVPKGSARQLSNALYALAKDEPRRLTMGQTARSLAEKHYHFDTYAQSMLNIYENLLVPH